MNRTATVGLAFVLVILAAIGALLGGPAKKACRKETHRKSGQNGEKQNHSE